MTIVLSFRRFLARLGHEPGGNVLVLVALSLPVLLATMGLAVESGNWYMIKRSMQNAADAAAVAAATNGTATYAKEAKAVTSQYGYTAGVGNTTVTASDAAACPSGSGTCYSVTVSRKIPLIVAALVGFNGNATIGSARAVSLTATAIARQGTAPRTYCVFALAGSGTAVSFVTNGAPKADLTGCSIMSNTSMTCNGSNLNATYGDAAGTNNGCGLSQSSGLSTLPDPYSSLASNMPTNPCSSYPQEPTSKKGTALPAGNQWTGSKTLSGNTIICGDLQLTGNTTLSGSGTIVIENGRLDTNGYTLKTAGGASATVIFSGTTTNGYTHAPTGGGTLDIAAPSGGAWSGVAIYQDPKLTSGVNIAAAGNSPTWDITGLVYLPHASVTFSGAVNKSSNGKSCFVLVVDNVTINGTASILSTGGCDDAGLTMPQSNLPSRGQLVA